MEQTASSEMGPGGVPKGAQTHQYYRCDDVPARFDNPGDRRTILNNPGNPVASCRYPPDIDPPSSSDDYAAQASEWFQGYGGKTQHPMYKTTAADYGSRVPSVHTMPTQFYSRSQKFTGHLGPCGMYRNFSLNTEVDKSKV